MYLVHLHLRRADDAGRSERRGRDDCAELPPQTGSWVRAAARWGDGVEHVALHAQARPGPVLGVYLLADCLDDAEKSAARVCGRTLAARPELRCWSLVNGRTVLSTAYYEGLLDDSGPPGEGPEQASAVSVQLKGLPGRPKGGESSPH
jgi:hypothetical protein